MSPCNRVLSDLNLFLELNSLLSAARRKELLEKGLPADLDAAFAASASVEGPIPDLPTPIAITTTTLPGYLSKIRGSAAGLQARARGLLTSLESLREHNARLEEQARMSAQQAAQAAKEHAETKTALARAQKAEERMVEEVQRYKVILVRIFPYSRGELHELGWLE